MKVTSSARSVRSIVTEGVGELGNNKETVEKFKKQQQCERISGDETLKIQSKEDLVGTEAAREYLALLWRKYQFLKKQEFEGALGLRTEKSKILEEVCRNLDLERKSAIRLMNSETAPRRKRSTGTRQRKYSKESQTVLKKLWHKMGRMCSENMHAALPEWLPLFFEEAIEQTTKQELYTMSASTIERYLKKEKIEWRRKSNSQTKKSRRLLTTIPLRDNNEKIEGPGFVEADTVSHCGDSARGTFAHTMTCTDIASGWTECDAIWGKDAAGARQALKEIENRLPFKLQSFFSDNGNEFMNKDVIAEFHFAGQDNRIQVPQNRGRPKKSNDQCFVEQKNHTHVRQLFGYSRINWPICIQLMNSIYRNEWRQIQNYFTPQKRLIEKVRAGSKLKRRFDKPRTPFERLLESPTLPIHEKERLLKEKELLNPFEIRRRLQKKLNTFFRYLDNVTDKGRHAS